MTYEKRILSVWAKANVLHTKIKNKISNAALLILQKRWQTGLSEKRAG